MISSIVMVSGSPDTHAYKYYGRSDIAQAGREKKRRAALAQAWQTELPAQAAAQADQAGRFGSLRGSGPRQAGLRSAGVSVCCDGWAAPAGRPAGLPTDPVSFGPSRSLRSSYSFLAPVCAFCPNAAAACEPTAQASG